MSCVENYNEHFATLREEIHVVAGGNYGCGGHFMHTLTLLECVSACKGVHLKQEGLSKHTISRHFKTACSSFDWKYFKSTIFYLKMVQHCLESLSLYYAVIICRLRISSKYLKI